MDGLSAAASVIAVIQIAKAVGSVLKDYYGAVRDARGEIKQLYHSVNSLEAILSCIEDLKVRHGDKLVSSDLLDNPDGPLQKSNVELKTLQEKLVDKAKSRSRFKQAFDSLKWPFQKGDVEKAVSNIDRHKSALQLQIGTESLNATLRHSDILKDIRSDIQKAQESQEVRLILDWLLRDVPDNSEEHNLCREKHEATTGSWLIEGDALKSWLTEKNSLLWLRGGAGTGKSILCSTVIDHVQELYKDEPNVAIAYWYFTFAATEKQKVSNFLCSLIADIYSKRRDTPQALQAAYEQSKLGRQRPTMDKMMTMLKAVMDGFQDVYLIADALDECPNGNEERPKLLDVGHQIHGWQLESVHMLVTSRREADIIRSLSAIPAPLSFFDMVEVQGAPVRNDIYEFLQKRLQRDPFRKWAHHSKWKVLKQDIIDNLASQADGMFRLVALQLEALGKSRTESEIRTAMAKLPQSLDAFYERILLGIPEHDAQRAHLALQWLAYSSRPITLIELAEALAVQPKAAPYVNDGERFISLMDLLEILPAGLVTTYAGQKIDDGRDDGWSLRFSDDEFEDVSELQEGHELLEGREDRFNGPRISENEREEMSENEVAELSNEEDWTTDEEDDFSSQAEDLANTIIKFAHFSVQEYLMSNRIINSPASGFQIPGTSGHNAIAEACLAYILYTGDKNLDMSRENFGNFVLFDYAAWWWPSHLAELQGKKISAALDELSRKFLDVTCNAWMVWVCWRHSAIDYTAVDTIPIHPILVASRVGLLDQLEWLLSGLPSEPDKCPKVILGESLVAAARGGHFGAVEMLLESGAEASHRIDARHHPTLTSTTALEEAVYLGSLKMVQLLLDNGVDPRTALDGSATALQSAAINSNTDMINLLLDHGVNVNVKGGFFGSALQAGAYGNYSQKIFQVLVEKEAGVMPETAIHETVLQLLDKGADVNAQGGYFGTSLQAASYACYLQTMLILLEHGADPNVEGGIYGNALQAVAHRGQLEAAQMLLDHGADVNAIGGVYGTALQAAACRCNLEMVQKLLQHGADVNVQGGFYGSALQAAAYHGDKGITQLLLEKGADVNAPGGDFGNALYAAVCSLETDIVHLLLEAGADPDSPNDVFENNLARAVHYANPDALEGLLEAGADITKYIPGITLVDDLEAAVSFGYQLKTDRNRNALDINLRYDDYKFESYKEMDWILENWMAEHKAKEGAYIEDVDSKLPVDS